MTISRLKTLSVALAFAVDIAPLAAQETAICYATHFGEGESGFSEMFVFGTEIYFRQQGAPNLLFNASPGFCSETETGAVQCAIECDGGRAAFREVDGALVVLAQHYRSAPHWQSLIGNNYEADGFGLDGLFVLDLQPAPVCKELGREVNQPTNVTLRAGDVMPAVEEIEALLSRLGYLATWPDWIFTADTARAVAQFQQSAGLDVTGSVDEITYGQLVQDAVMFGGGC